MIPFDELYQRLTVEDETTQIEAKKSSEIGPSVLETVSSFSNEPGLGGGYLLLGVSRIKKGEQVDYVIAGVNNTDKIQNDLANQCNGSFNVIVRPQMAVHALADGKRVVVNGIVQYDES